MKRMALATSLSALYFGLSQQIFAEENVAQCGYCTAGIVCSVTALFRKTKTPSDEQIKDTLNRHLCRCGSHSRILDAVYRIREGAIR